MRHNLPWVMMRDFNDVTKEDEKFGGNGICSRKVNAYNECMDFCNLFYLGFSSSKFTRQIVAIYLTIFNNDWTEFGLIQIGKYTTLRL